ncbi:hypothetical protein Scep_029697 [Stephania cephalantha]|uniref:Fe2OG dioxygenase domain-containing protein n=1 Tax=Stephania cephalantha TaxID=152367 RepID=A0AAP0DYE1_9MAGN
MAETSNTVKEDPSSSSLLAKHVQELAINGDEPPQRYIRKDRDREAPIDPSLSSSVPIIDLHLISSPNSSTQQKQDEIGKLKSALTSWGLFQAIGHGIPSSLLDELRGMAKGFFDLPVEEKKKYAMNKDGTQHYLEGYGNDLVVSEDQTLEWSDRLYLLIKPKDERKLNFWPENPSRFREVLNEYSLKSNLLAEFVLNVMAESLGLEGDYFLKQTGERGTAFARFNYYPPCSRPDHVYGIKPHADGGAITLVLQDKEVEGLQVFKDGKWIKVPVLPDAILINVADQIEIMSNGVYKSPVHRVITNLEKERFSVAVFYVPDWEKEIEPAAKLISESTPRLFRKIKMKEYGDVYFQKTSRGIRAIDWARA